MWLMLDLEVLSGKLGTKKLHIITAILILLAEQYLESKGACTCSGCLIFPELKLWIQLGSTKPCCVYMGEGAQSFFFSPSLPASLAVRG